MSTGLQKQSVKLRVVFGDDEGREVPISESPFIIGRAHDCDVHQSCSLVSRYHCALIQTENGWIVRDLGSKNGTCLNDETLLGPQLLRNGDQLGIGTKIYEILLSDEQGHLQPSTLQVSNQSNAPLTAFCCASLLV